MNTPSAATPDLATPSLATPVIAFDVGGTQLRSAYVGRDGRARQVVAGDVARGAGPLLAALIDAVDGQRRRAEAEGLEAPGALGLALTGFLDARAGIVRRSVALDLTEMPLAEALGDACGLPVRLVNDVNAAAWAEARARDGRDLVAVFVGTGVGTGAVCGGQLLEGHRGAALEGGHLNFRPGGLDCGAGLPEHAGCYEAYLGGTALGRRAQAVGLAPDAAGLLAAARSGMPAARELVDEACAALADLVARLVVVFDPEQVVLGGGVARHAPEFLEAARAAADPHPLGPDLVGVRVEPAMVDKEAGLLGAAWLAGGR